MAWQVNATAVGELARLAARLGVPFVTVSSDYVFDGTVESHAEDEAYSPLGVYGQSKAAGELAAQAAPAPTSCARAGSWATDRTS